MVHLAHSFERAQGGSADRAKWALRDIGRSVFKGGFSTFLGVVLLAAAPSAVFRIFFKMLVATVAFGLIIGLVVFPAAASILGCAIPPVSHAPHHHQHNAPAAGNRGLEVAPQKQQQQSGEGGQVEMAEIEVDTKV